MFLFFSVGVSVSLFSSPRASVDRSCGGFFWLDSLFVRVGLYHDGPALVSLLLALFCVIVYCVIFGCMMQGARAFVMPSCFMLLFHARNLQSFSLLLLRFGWAHFLDSVSIYLFLHPMSLLRPYYFVALSHPLCHLLFRLLGVLSVLLVCCLNLPWWSPLY